MTGVPKPTRWKSKKYLKFIRSKPCVFCQVDFEVQKSDSEPHHLRQFCFTGTGTKPSDSWSVPACRSHHDKDQMHPCKKAWLLQKCVEYLTEFIANG